MFRQPDEIAFITHVGNRIKAIREEKELTLSEVARRLYVERGNYSRIETGKTNPSCLTLFKLAKVLDCNVQDFFVDQSSTKI